MPREEECNIEAKGQQRRRTIGIFSLVLGGMFAGFAIGFHFTFIERLLAFPFFAAGFISLLESQQKVCVLYAYQNKTEVSGNVQKTNRNPFILSTANRIILHGIAAALICTAIVAFLSV